ncbi:Prostaglandin E2 receptor EP4 subtype, partial [Armadillidium nasatum]
FTEKCLMNDSETLVSVSNIFVRPCVNGNSSTGEHFNFSISESNCNADKNCTALNAQPGASMVSPIILSLTGISGQIASLIYLHRSSRPSSHRTTFYVMLATLIWTDLIGKFITTPLPILSYVYGHWMGGEITCNLHGYSMSLIGIVTHLLVALMALERYLGIRCGYFYNRNVTTSRTRIILISLWIFGLIYCSLPFVGIGEFKLHYPGSWCHINQHICSDHPWPNKIFSNLYSTINLTCLFLIVFCNFVVVGTLLKMRVTKYRPSTSCRQMPPKKPREREIQMVILLVIITITFIFSWAPHDLLMIKNQIWPQPPNRNPILDMQAIRLVSINQIVDPWSYIICRIIFRSKLWVCCRGVLVENFPYEYRKSLTENSDSTSEQDCRLDLNSCFSTPNQSMKKPSLFPLSIRKWFKSSKDKTNHLPITNEGQDLRITSISKTKKDFDVERGKNFLQVSFNKYEHQKGKLSCGNIDVDESMFPLLEEA